MNMSKRARYDGPFPEVLVDLSEGDVNSTDHVTVERGKLLPDSVPAKIRDELLAGPDWSEVKQADQTKTDDKE
jgi:hypothetical protein